MQKAKKFVIELLFDKSISYFPTKDDSEFWNNFVKIVSDQIVIPTAYFKLSERRLLDKIPDDLKKYLYEIFDFSRIRNKTIFDECNLIEKELKRKKISFIFLKGASFLRTIYSKTIGIRMMHDIDILVKKRDILRARSLVLGLGFVDRGFTNKFNIGKHLPRLIKRENNIGLELHHRLTTNNKYFDYDKIFKNPEKSFLSVSDNMLHIILNSEYSDNGTLLGLINLRSKYDFYNLNKLKNNFSFDKNIYSKIFLIKMNYLRIYDSNNIHSHIYYAYLALLKTIPGKIIYHFLNLLIKLKLRLIQFVEFCINSNFRKYSLTLIRERLGKQ